jgi:hypothetical protein
MFSSLPSIFKQFGTILSSPFSSHARAAGDSTYNAANFAGIQTYDFPSKCYTNDPLSATPADGTNIQQVIPGILNSELTWDLVSDADQWYAFIYERLGDDPQAGDKAEQIYNCHLLDSAVRGSLGYLYGYTKDNGLDDNAPASAANDSTSVNGTCGVNAPVYGSVNGQGNQYSQEELARIFGNPGTLSSHKEMEANLVSVDFLGHSVLINKLAAPCLKAVVDEIQAQNVSYKIRKMGCYRYDSNNGSSNIWLKSYHTYGVACDINWDTNPWSGDGSPKPYDLPQSYIKAFHNHGFTWGGNWQSVKDYMHFEFNGITP